MDPTSDAIDAIDAANAGEPRGPLSGIRVVELASYISAPLGAMMLADLGADVLKIEPPKGDPMRRLGRHPAGVSPMWVNSNRGKRSITLDLKQPAAQQQARELLRTADVLISNWRLPVAARLGLHDDDLVAANPNLIRIYVTGFGTGGPLADSPAYDSIIQARAGLTEANGTDDEPALDSSFIVDKIAAMTVCQAALAAIVGRQLHGHADRVDLAMLDAAAYANFADVMASRTFAHHSPPSARNPQPSTVRPMRTSDGWIVLLPVTGDQVRRTMQAVGHPELVEVIMAVPDAADLTRRMYLELEPILRRGTTQAWLTALAEHDVPAAPCLTIDEHLDDAQVLHNDLYQVHEWPGWEQAGPMRQVRYPAIFSSWGPLHSRGGPPLLAR